MPSRIDMDHNATTRPFPEVIDAVRESLANEYGNPGSRHAEGRRSRQALEQARESMAEILGAKPSEVIFTSGGTESTNLALFGLAQGRPGTICLTAGEHPATMGSCRHLQSLGWKLHLLDVDTQGRLVPDQFDALDWDDVKLVTIILAHNETGTIQDTGQLADLCQQYHVPFHVDAVQAVGKIPVNFHDSKATSLSLGAHKFYGPRGVGALLLSEGVDLKPLLFGGHQESGRRPGTEPVALIVGMARALEMWQRNREQWTEQVTDLRDRLERGLKECCAPCLVNGSSADRLPNTLNISFPGIDGEAFLVAIDMQGIACSLGSTCASGSTEPAPALVAMSCPPEVYRSAVRFSVGIDNTVKEIDEAIGRIGNVVDQLRRTEGVSISR